MLSALVGVMDQGVCSLSNLLAVLVAAVLLPPETFGYFAIAYALYVLLLNASQAFVSQWLVLQTEDRRRASGVAASSAALMGAGGGLCLFIGALVMVPHTQLAAFVVLAAFLPLLILQDALRTVSVIHRIPQVALTADLLWLVLFGGSVPLLLTNAGIGSGAVMLCWAGSGAVSVAVSARMLRRRIAWRVGPRSVLRSNYLGRRFLVEFLIGQGTNQSSVVAIGGFAGPTATGALRGAGTLFGPVGVLISSVPVLLVPPLRQLSNRARAAAYAMLCVASVALSLGMVLLLSSLPHSWGSRLLGQTWNLAEPLMAPLGCQMAAIGVGTVAVTALRLVRPTDTLPIRAVGAVISLCAFWGGYLLGGVEMAAWGLCIGSSVQAAIAWLVYWRIRR